MQRLVPLVSVRDATNASMASTAAGASPHSAPKQGEATEFRKVFWLSWPCQVYDLNEYSTVSGLAVALLTAWRTVAAVVDEPPLNQTNPSAQGNPPQASLGLQDATHTFKSISKGAAQACPPVI